MIVRARVVARSVDRDRAIEIMRERMAGDDWSDWSLRGPLSLVSKNSNGPYWLATATMEREVA